MIKLTANLCKKVPIAGMSYSSQSFMAGLEVEISEHSNNADICARIKEVYKLLEQSVDEQICDTENTASRTHNNSQHQYAQKKRNNNFRPASKAQVKAVYAISKADNISRDALTHMLRNEYHVDKPEDLAMSQASELISRLKDSA